MTNNDYILVGNAIKQIDIVGGDKITIALLITTLCHFFKGDNNKFDASIFINACKPNIK